MEGDGTGGREGEGEGVGEEREGCLVFSMSRPVNPTHNPCTCRMTLICCPAMAREQILTESINLSTKETTQTIHHILQNCSRCIENYCFKHKNLDSFRSFAPWPHTGGSAPGPPMGAPPPEPHYRLELPRSP